MNKLYKQKRKIFFYPYYLYIFQNLSAEKLKNNKILKLGRCKYTLKYIRYYYQAQRGGVELRAGGAIAPLSFGIYLVKFWEFLEIHFSLFTVAPNKKLASAHPGLNHVHISELHHLYTYMIRL